MHPYGQNSAPGGNPESMAKLISNVGERIAEEYRKLQQKNAWRETDGTWEPEKRNFNAFPQFGELQEVLAEDESDAPSLSALLKN